VSHSRDRIVRAAVVGAFVLVLAACGTSTSTTTTTASGQVQVSCHIEFAKTKFLLHSGIAVGAFQRYIFKPYRAGTFKKGAPGRRTALLKAGATAVLVGHELKLAARDAQCDGPVLKKLAGPLALAVTAFAGLKVALLGGDLAGIPGAGSALGTLVAKAAESRVSINSR
jgi:hypothetical protein